MRQLTVIKTLYKQMFIVIKHCMPYLVIKCWQLKKKICSYKTCPYKHSVKAKKLNFLNMFTQRNYVMYMLSSDIIWSNINLTSYFSKPNKQCIVFEQNQQSRNLFKENLDILTSKAERLYYNGDFDSAYLICRK